MLSIIDSGIILTYIFGLLILGWFLGKNNKDQEDYFLAKRSMPWLPIALSVAATMISANGFVGGPGWAYNSGISPFMVHIGIPIAIAFVMLTTMPVIYNLKITSVYEYVELRLGPISRILAVVGFIANSLIQISSMVFIPSLILSTFTGWNILIIVPIVVITSIIYTILGGIKAVIWTDAIQMVVMWFALLFSMFFILNKLNLSFFETIKVAKAAGKLQVFDWTWNIKSSTAVWATLIGGTFMWVRYFGFDQGQVQRILTSKSIKDVKKTFFVSALTMNIMYFVLLLFGVMLYVYFGGQKFTSSNNILIEFISKHLPVGVIGITIAGVFAAAMSSVDSLLNSITTAYTKDIHERFFNKGKGIFSLKATMITTLIWGLIICLFTIFGFVGKTKSILAVVGSYISYISGPMLGMFILSMFTKKANDKGVAFGSIIGFISTYIISKNLGNGWIWNPAIGGILTFIFGYILSFEFAKSNKINSKQFTVVGQREYLINQKNIQKHNLPLHLDKYTVYLLIFFVLQFVILWLISK